MPWKFKLDIFKGGNAVPVVKVEIGAAAAALLCLPLSLPHLVTKAHNKNKVAAAATTPTVF